MFLCKCVCVLCVCVCVLAGECGALGFSSGFCVGLFSTRDAGSVDWNPSGHQGHLIPSLPKHWTKCSYIIHVYITLLLCKVFTQSFCRTVYCTDPLDVSWQTFPDRCLRLYLSLSLPDSCSCFWKILEEMHPNKLSVLHKAWTDKHGESRAASGSFSPLWCIQEQHRVQVIRVSELSGA